MRWVWEPEGGEAEQGTTPLEQYAIRLADIPIPPTMSLAEVVGAVDLYKHDIIKTSTEGDDDVS